MTDEAIKAGNIDDFSAKLNDHIDRAVHEKYKKVAELNKVKDISTEQRREYVEAYVDYTHTVEAIHDNLEHGGGHASHDE